MLTILSIIPHLTRADFGLCKNLSVFRPGSVNLALSYTMLDWIKLSYSHDSPSFPYGLPYDRRCPTEFWP